MASLLPRRSGVTWLLAAMSVAVFASQHQMAIAQPAADEDASAVVPASSEEPADEEIVVPDGTAPELLTFIKTLAAARPAGEGEVWRSRRRKQLEAIVEAAGKILSGEPTDSEAGMAAYWTVDALSAMASLGDASAPGKIDAFIEKSLQDPRMTVVKEAARQQFMQKLQNWQRLSTEERAAAVETFVGYAKQQVELQDAYLLNMFGNMADNEDGPAFSAALEALVPLWHEQNDPRLEAMLPLLEGISRLLNLTGNKLELEGTFMDGTELDWESYRGKVVLVDFWATWCGPCQREVPNILANYEDYHDKGFEVIGICLDESRERAVRYIERMDLPWPSLFSDDPDNSGPNHPMAIRYGVTAIPRAILVNGEGIVVHMNARDEMLGEQLELLLGKPATAQADEAKTEKPGG